MALKVSDTEVPKYAVTLSEKEAIQYRWKQIRNWKPDTEMWPFKYGIPVLGALTSISGLYINLRLRNIMKIRRFGTASSGITLIVCPGILTSLAQVQVSENTFLPMRTCPLCVEMKSICVQNFSSIVYPIILAPIVNVMVAKRTGTFRLPYYTNWKEVLYFGFNLVKPIFPSLPIISGINSVAAMFITYKQFNCISYMQDVLNMIEESTDEDTMF
ncbi:hypothetical protein M0802_009757 [Mischocyttarus mexicanus]|nr:hypothetical protein M0802_009757 [Mischocyttarus mexicanus]